MSSAEATSVPREWFAEAPSREPHVPVVEVWADLVHLAEDHPERELEFLHRQMNEEANVLENAASSLVDFPDADWDIRMWLARQCSDEARHVISYKRLLETRGGKVGQFPVLNFQYRIIRKIDSLIGRLAVQNRTFEADGLDAASHAESVARRKGDVELADVYASQGADEIIHVGFANAWIRRAVKADPRNIMRMARALAQGAQSFVAVAAGGGRDVASYGVAHEERRLAGFEPGEIEVAHDQAEARRAAARARATAGA
jgi:hypothetical protein